MYLLGLRKLQSKGQGEKLGWYQLAGIHGRPFIPWDGVNQDGGGGNGYCSHGSNIFPTWHRPYLALFEEVLYLNCRQAISEFPAGAYKDRLIAALSTFRIPYWDWAAIPPSGQGNLPWSVQRPTIEVTLPNGTTTIRNPLYSYVFQNVNHADIVDSPYNMYNQTMRDATSKSGDAVSQNDKVALKMDEIRPNMQSRVYNILAMQKDYLKMSNDVTSWDSLEATHNTIHTSCGGHMDQPAYSAFDPLFWLHHTNVDRVFTIWQALNPDVYVEPMLNPFSTFTRQGGHTADANTPLHPFHRNDGGEFWTSEGVRSTTTFAYTYPDLADLDPKNTTPLVRRVNELYGPEAHSLFKRDVTVADDLTKRSNPTPLKSRAVAGAPSFSGLRQYIASIKVQKFSKHGSFNIHVFLGDAPGPDPGQWSSEESWIGMTGIFAATPGGVENTHAKNSGIEANGAVPLTAALEAKIRSKELRDMREGIVEGYLRANLRWRVAKTNNEQIDVEDTPGFQISVVWSEVVPATSKDEFPQ
ncbi:Di-copper centre-containing protein, partial [Amniculicola lignicola CBS 123094]